jgi:hypothetical protein
VSNIPEDIRKTAEAVFENAVFHDGESDAFDMIDALGEAILAERKRWAFNKRVIRMMAYFYSNTNRWDLEAAGLIPEGPSGDMLWKRFNHDFDVFILKLSDDKQEALAALMSRYIFPEPHPGIASEPVKAVEAAE